MMHCLWQYMECWQKTDQVNLLQSCCRTGLMFRCAEKCIILIWLNPALLSRGFKLGITFIAIKLSNTATKQKGGKSLKCVHWYVLEQSLSHCNNGIHFLTALSLHLFKTKDFVKNLSLWQESLSWWQKTEEYIGWKIWGVLYHLTLSNSHSSSILQRLQSW